jgi:hypothetical protein
MILCETTFSANQQSNKEVINNGTNRHQNKNLGIMDILRTCGSIRSSNRIRRTRHNQPNHSRRNAWRADNTRTPADSCNPASSPTVNGFPNPYHERQDKSMGKHHRAISLDHTRLGRPAHIRSKPERIRDTHMASVNHRHTAHHLVRLQVAQRNLKECARHFSFDHLMASI